MNNKDRILCHTCLAINGLALATATGGWAVLLPVGVLLHAFVQECEAA